MSGSNPTGRNSLVLKTKAAKASAMIGSQARKPVLCKTGVDIINKKCCSIDAKRLQNTEKFCSSFQNKKRSGTPSECGEVFLQRGFKTGEVFCVRRILDHIVGHEGLTDILHADELESLVHG